MTLGEFIRNYRCENNITMEELAMRSELSKGYISMLEKDKNPNTKRPIIPSFKTLKQLAKGMNIDVERFLTLLDVSQVIKITDASDTDYVEYQTNLTSAEKKLLDDYNKLNNDGKDKATEYVADLTTIEKYTAPGNLKSKLA